MATSRAAAAWLDAFARSLPLPDAQINSGGSRISPCATFHPGGARPVPLPRRASVGLDQPDLRAAI